jgi:hypothetical protein
MTPHYALEAAKCSATDGARSALEDVQFAQVSDEWTIPTPEDDWRAFGNWNGVRSWVQGQGYTSLEDDTPERLLRVLESMGLECEWSDEWTMCDDCCRMFRSSPDCYDWRMWGEIDSESQRVSCGHCLAEDPEDYLAGKLDNPRSAVNTTIVHPKDEGFANMNGDFENGMHPGQNDNPEEILEAYQAKYPGKQFLFTYEPSQFYTTFQIWGRDCEREEG